MNNSGRALLQLSRRAFIKSTGSVGVLGAGSLAGASAFAARFSDVEVDAQSHLVYERGNVSALHVVSKYAPSAGQVYALDGNLEAFWRNHLTKLSGKSNPVLFGITGYDALFCLKLLAGDIGYRLVQVSEVFDSSNTDSGMSSRHPDKFNGPVIELPPRKEGAIYAWAFLPRRSFRNT